VQIDDVSALASLDIVVLGADTDACYARWHNTYPPLLFSPPEPAHARAAELAFDPALLAQRDGFRTYLSASEENTVAGVLGSFLSAERHYAAALRAAVADELDRQVGALHGWLMLPPPPPPLSPTRPNRKRAAGLTPPPSPRKTKRARVDVFEVAKQLQAAIPPPAPSPALCLKTREEHRLLANARARDSGVSPRPARVSVRVLGGCGPQLETQRCRRDDWLAAVPFGDATNFSVGCAVAGAQDEDDVF
jgi:hypothetical protein